MILLLLLLLLQSLLLLLLLLLLPLLLLLVLLLLLFLSGGPQNDSAHSTQESIDEALLNHGPRVVRSTAWLQWQLLYCPAVVVMVVARIVPCAIAVASEAATAAVVVVMEVLLFLVS